MSTVALAVTPRLFSDALARVLRSHDLHVIQLDEDAEGPVIHLDRDELAYDVAVASGELPDGAWRNALVQLPAGDGPGGEGVVVTPTHRQRFRFRDLAQLVALVRDRAED